MEESKPACGIIKKEISSGPTDESMKYIKDILSNKIELNGIQSEMAKRLKMSTKKRAELASRLEAIKEEMKRTEGEIDVLCDLIWSTRQTKEGE